MTDQSVVRRHWQRRVLTGLIGLAVLAPVFAWAAERTGYAEPMENAATLVGAASSADPPMLSVLSGYTVPGLGPHLGTLGAALGGTVLTLVLAVAVGRALAATT